jgi:hypothetical protein
MCTVSILASLAANIIRSVRSVCFVSTFTVQHSKKLARVGGRDSNVLPNGIVTC